jgi:hypothetical protein
MDKPSPLERNLMTDSEGFSAGCEGVVELLRILLAERKLPIAEVLNGIYYSMGASVAHLSPSGREYEMLFKLNQIAVEALYTGLQSKCQHDFMERVPTVGNA